MAIDNNNSKSSNLNQQDAAKRNPANQSQPAGRQSQKDQSQDRSSSRQSPSNESDRS